MRVIASIHLTIKGRNNDEPFIRRYELRTRGYSEWSALLSMVKSIGEYGS